MADSNDVGQSSLDKQRERRREGSIIFQFVGPFKNADGAWASVGLKAEKPAVWNHWIGAERGFASSSSTHASLAIYKCKTYTKDNPATGMSDQKMVLLDPEADPQYESIHPGTVTIEGFGIEAWDHGKQHSTFRAGFVSAGDTPPDSGLEYHSLLRRLDELQRGPNEVGARPQVECEDLIEFYGRVNDFSHTRNVPNEPRVLSFYLQLNRTDYFTDFSADKFIMSDLNRSMDEVIKSLRSIILAKELALRLQSWPPVQLESWPVKGHRSFTCETLAALIVQDLWFENVKIELEPLRLTFPKRNIDPEIRVLADGHARRGDEAARKLLWEQAERAYNDAVLLDHGNAVYRVGRSEARLALGKLDKALEDAVYATCADPDYAKAWAQKGAMELKADFAFIALGSYATAYEKAVVVAKDDEAEAVIIKLSKEGLAKTRAKLAEQKELIEKETDPEARRAISKRIRDREWMALYKTVRARSLVSQRQIDGLVYFATRMKWPYLEELTITAEDVCSRQMAAENHPGRELLPLAALDWWYGLSLPGRYMAFKLMTALLFCTPSFSPPPSVKDHAAAALVSDEGFGVFVNGISYWRIRTVLGRVLGALPGVISLSGWLGPCPGIKFNNLPSSTRSNNKGEEIKANIMTLMAPRVSPMRAWESCNDSDGVPIGPERRECMERYAAAAVAIKDEDQNLSRRLLSGLALEEDEFHTVSPPPPAKGETTVVLKSITLQYAMSRHIEESERLVGGGRYVEVKDGKSQYLASIAFDISGIAEEAEEKADSKSVTYNLYTTPTFVTLPPCKPGPIGSHQVTTAELPLYQIRIWTVAELKDCDGNDDGDDDDGGVIVIHTSEGSSEVLARAWCAEKGKNAVVVRKKKKTGGPCFVCSVSSSSKAVLGCGVLIWVS